MTRLRTFTGSFRTRLFVGYLLIATIFAVAWGWSLYNPLTQAALQQQTKNLTAVARSGALVASGSGGSAQRIATTLVADSDLRVTIVAADGKVLADSQTDPVSMENHASRPEIAAALAGGVGSDSRRSRTQGLDELYVAVPATIAGEPVALRVSERLSAVQGVIARSRGIALGLLGLALALAAAIAAWASAAASRPVAELSQAAGQMAAGNLSVPIPEVPGDLAVLAESLGTLREQMRARLGALEAEQQTLRTTLDGLGDAVFLLDGRRVRFANAAATSLLRYRGTGPDSDDIASAGLPETVSAAITSALETGETRTLELGPDPRGTTYRLTVTGLGSRGAIAVVSDITELARLDRVRRDFVANASHELKTPVSGIQLLAESAAHAASDGDVETAMNFTNQIGSEAGRLRRLVNDLLDLSRLEAAPKPGVLVDVRTAVGNAILGHRAAATRKGVELETDLSAVRGMDVFATSDATDLAVALDNLIDNAIAYTDAGRVTVGVKASEHWVKITVADTGPGIDEEHLPRIFERFYRVDRARDRESGGTGLGLALVKHVVERSGGVVVVDSTPGAGTTFTIRLPRAT